MLIAYVGRLAAAAPSIEIETNLARYRPGQSVKIHVSTSSGPGWHYKLTCYHLGRKIGFNPFRRTSRDLIWRPRGQGHGYLLVGQLLSSTGQILAKSSCGVDVSKRWTDFPRYGYLAHFGPGLTRTAGSTIADLNRFHIDGIQFYDWQWRHHHPLPPGDDWVDIAKRPTSGATVRAFIHAAHARNMSCLAYNLGFGAVDGYEADKISPAWMLYYDRKAQKPYALNMPKGWATTKLYMMNPGDRHWRDAIYPRERAAIKAFGFDGWHMDQLGDMGKLFNAAGAPVILKAGYPALLAGAKKEAPGDLIFNNVGGYGIEETLKSPTDAMYTEAWQWTGQKSYADLKTTIEHMRSGGKSAILAAYMDYERAKAYADKPPGVFNLPGILLTDATIFASGGFHLELGDAGMMLDNEYFPNHNLEPSPSLLDRLKPYYDFLVANEDLLSARDVKPVKSPVSVGNHVWSFARRKGKSAIVHLINLAQPAGLEWRDPNGDRPTPQPLKNLRVRLSGNWHSAYLATPDDGIGAPHSVPIRDDTILVPRLDYWTMLVLKK